MEFQAKDMKETVCKKEVSRHRGGKTRSISPTSTSIDQLLSVFAAPKPRPSNSSLPSSLSQVQIELATIPPKSFYTNSSSLVPIAHQQQQQLQPQKQKQPKQKKTPHLNTLLNNDLYKTEMCRSFEETGACRYGSRCQFAHGIHDLRVVERHPRYKTDICKTFIEKGFCAYGKRCRFSHFAPQENTLNVILHGDATETGSQYFYEGMGGHFNQTSVFHHDDEYPSCAQQTGSSIHSSEQSPTFHHANSTEQQHMSSLFASLSLDSDTMQTQELNQSPLAPYPHHQTSPNLGFSFHETMGIGSFDVLNTSKHQKSPLIESAKHSARDFTSFGNDSLEDIDHDHSYGSEHSFGHDSEIETRSQDLSLSPTDMKYGQWNSCHPAAQRRLPIFEKFAH